MERPAPVFKPAYPPPPLWGFRGDREVTAPGPVRVGHYGRPMVVRFRNELPQDHLGFGSAEISVHLHNGHTASENDGFPRRLHQPGQGRPHPGRSGQFKDPHYGTICADDDGFQNRPGPRVLKFVVDRQPPEQDLSQVPDRLRELRPLAPEEVSAAPAAGPSRPGTPDTGGTP